ncbi:MAG TPA: membrane protein insertase YidC, partial [Candidatus Deferrimicrobiaceae bacterium]
MQKNMMLAIILSIAILLGYQYFFAPPPKAPAPLQGTAQDAGKDNAARPAPQQGSAAPAPPAEMAPPGGLVPKTIPPVRQIRVSTPLYTATISTGGGGIPSFLLNGYKDVPGPKGKPLEIIGSDGTRPLPLDLYLGESQPSFPPVPVFASAAPDALAVRAGEKKSVVLTWESARGVRIVREYEFSGDRYDFTVREQVSNGSKEPIRVRPGFELSQEFKGELAADSYTFTGAVVETGGKIEQFDLKKIGKGNIGKIPVSWAAADSKYFGLILMPEKPWTLERIGLSGETGIRMSVADAPAALSPGETVRS